MPILDAQTLFTRFAAPGEAVHRTIETGGWIGLVWPGNADWDNHLEGTQLLGLALHYFTLRHPAIDTLPLATAAQVLASHAVERFEGYALEVEALYQQAQSWLWAFAGGGPGDQEQVYAWMAPRAQEGDGLRPGGNAVAFTHAAVDLIETLCFQGPQQAWELAVHYLAQQGDDASQRAAHLLRLVTQPRPDPDEVSICTDCGVPGLEVFYEGQHWGEKLCQDCFDRRLHTGQARLREE